jgi:hypothetical protein
MNKEQKYIRAAQYDQPKAHAWEVAADRIEEEGWSAHRIVYTKPGQDPNKGGDDAGKK